MNAYDREQLSDAQAQIADLEELRDCQLEEIRELNLALTALQEKYDSLLLEKQNK